MSLFSLAKPPGFALSAVQAYYANVAPGSGTAAASLEPLTLAFRVDGTFAPALAALREQSNSLLVEFAGNADPGVVAKQLRRILGLEADSAAWFALGESDLVVGDLQRAFPGFLSVAQSSPYEAAIGAVISPRMNQQQAARIQQALARQQGDALELNGTTRFALPSPERLRALRSFPGLSEEKIARLRAVAQAAQDGLLDAEHLRHLGEARALAELQKLHGVGSWAASQIYFHGAAPCDGLPTAEPRLLDGLASAYRLRSPSFATFQRIAVGWRPFRMWVCVLLMRHLAARAGGHAPGLDAERASAGQALLRRTMTPRDAA